MKKTIIFLASYAPSLIQFRLHLLQAFSQKNYRVIALAPYDEKVEKVLKAKNILYQPINLSRNGLNPLHDLLLINKLVKLFKQYQPTILFSYTLKPIIYGSLAAKIAKVPAIYSLVTGTGYIFLNHNLKSKIVGFVAKQLLRRALSYNHLVFFQNKDNEALFKKLQLIAHTSTNIVNGSGVDCEYYQETPLPIKISFLMIARFLYDKGIIEYIEAAKKIQQSFPEIECKLVGWIDTNPNAISRKLLTEWINKGYITYLGQLEDVRPAFADSTIYVLPSYHEGTPRTVLEAMAMGRPIITTDAPGCKETIIPHYNGLKIPVKNSLALYEAMHYFITHAHLIPIMGQNSRLLAVEKYDVNRVNQHMMNAMGIS